MAAVKPKRILVKTTIPPHVANVLMRELHAATPQEAVDKVIVMMESEKPKRSPKGRK